MESPRRKIVMTWITIALAEACLLCWMMACGGGESSGNATASPSLSPAFAAEYADLRTCAAKHQRSLAADSPPVVYVPTVRCDNGPFCCVSPIRGGQEGSGTVYLPDECDLEGGDVWLAHAYRHESLHARLAGEDGCHTDALWKQCVDSKQADRCTA